MQYCTIDRLNVDGKNRH